MGHPATGVNHNMRPAEGKKVAAKLNSKVTYRAVSNKSVHLAALYLVGQGTSGLLDGLATPQIYSAALNHWERHAAPPLLISHHMRGSHAMACQRISAQAKGHHAMRTIHLGRQSQQQPLGKLSGPRPAPFSYTRPRKSTLGLFLCHATPQKFRRTPSCVRPTTPGRLSSLDF